MKPILEVHHVSKKFILNHQSNSYFSLRDKLTNIFRHTEKEDFWALQDINFEIQKGDSVGIIGRNGAGKSTLLKILSRITHATSGRIISRGRIASLLEVGTGFHLELTGRENVFMNGSILGMKNNEIKNKFDQIIEFSGTERFLDTQLKHYSSGMQLRLAFAVAAHLEPEILIIDEVLAVGDAEYQRKCINKMNDIVQQGSTLLIVSHNLESISRLCKSGIFLENGKIAFTGDINVVLKKYQEVVTKDSKIKIDQRSDRKGNGLIRFNDIFLANLAGERLLSAFSGQDCQLIFEFIKSDENSISTLQLDIGIKSEMDEKLTWFSTTLENQTFKIQKRTGRIHLKINNLPLMPGNYKVTLFCKSNGEVADWVTDAFQFSIEPGDFFGNGKLINKEWGYFLIKHHFSIE